MDGGYDIPERNCPYCGHKAFADWCDIGVGYQQAGPFHCMSCGASEIGPYDKERALTAEEKRTGWYAPGAEPGSSANVIDGKIVDHETMRAAYHDEFAGNPRYRGTGAVEDWFLEVRKPSEPGS